MSYHDWQDRNRRRREWRIRVTWLMIGALAGYALGMVKL